QHAARGRLVRHHRRGAHRLPRRRPLRAAAAAAVRAPERRRHRALQPRAPVPGRDRGPRRVGRPQRHRGRPAAGRARVRRRRERRIRDLAARPRRPAGALAERGAGAAVGIAVALVAALLAVRTAFASSTVEALRPVAVESEGERGLGAVVAGLLMIAATWLVAVADPRSGWLVIGIFVASQLVAYVGGALLAPSIVTLAGSAVRGLVARSQSLPMRLAGEELPRRPGRHRMTVTDA